MYEDTEVAGNPFPNADGGEDEVALGSHDLQPCL
jgi:hypothetical protein